jgi:hypothetical protein
MTRTYYDLIDVAPTASVDEIKRAFRREIAKYHPDKVQHLGQEFQDIAVSKAAELTQAYKTLSDAIARAEYDATLEPAASAAASPSPSHASPAAPPFAEPAPRSPRSPFVDDPTAAGGGSLFATERAGATDLILKATVARVRRAVEQEFAKAESVTAPGFDLAQSPVKTGLFAKTLPIVVGRFVPQVTGAAVRETWRMAVRIRKEPQRDVCVFVLAPTVAPAGELAVAIAEQRRRAVPGGGRIIMVPVNTQNWNAHVPTDAPPVVKSLLTRMKSA